MAAFLTGLKDLGLECLENTDIFGEKKQEVKQSEKTEKPVADIPKEEDIDQEVMSRRLREISVLLTPTALFTEKEVSRLREIFVAESGR